LMSRGSDLRNTLSEDLSGAMRDIMLPEQSTMNSTASFAHSGSLNFGTRVTIGAFESGIIRCVSGSVLGKERLTHLMRRMKSLPSSVGV
jgi:hypothetical protein